MDKETFLRELAAGEIAKQQAAESESKRIEVMEAKKTIDEVSKGLLADIREARANEVLEARQRAEALISTALALSQPLTTFEDMGRKSVRGLFGGGYELKGVNNSNLDGLSTDLDSAMGVPRLFPIGTAQVEEKVSKVYARLSLFGSYKYYEDPNRVSFLSKGQQPLGIAIDFQADVLPTQLIRRPVREWILDRRYIFGLVQDSGDNTCWAAFGRDLTEEGVSTEVVRSDLVHSRWNRWDHLPIDPESDEDILFFSRHLTVATGLADAAWRAFERDLEDYQGNIANAEATLAMIQDESLHLRAA